jgi:homoserine kinase
VSRIFAPATSANLSVGFDNLGIALRPLSGILGDEVLVAPSGIDGFTVTGPYAGDIAGPNIVLRALERVRADCGHRDPVAVELHKGMPVGSGLGSSAASVVAAVRAFNEHYGRPLDQEAEMAMMGELEAELSGGLHWDNIMPCALGGLRLGDTRLPVPASWIWLVVYPGIRLETRAMREVLPLNIPLGVAVAQAARLGRFVDALHRGDGPLAASLMVDPVIEPCRSPMIPGYAEFHANLLSTGALAAGISGSGPTIFAVFDDAGTAAQALAHATDWARTVSSATKGSNAFASLCSVDELGARSVDLGKKEQPHGILQP